MYKRFLAKILCVILIISTLVISGINLVLPQKAYAADFNPNNLVDDSKFIDVNSMSINDIQGFLERWGSYLKDYSEAGRSAAHIIYDAAQGWVDDAGGDWYGIININHDTGTVSPKVILVTLQKEQSLISRSTRDDWAMTASMGYGCYSDAPGDSNSNGCTDKYEGFANQVNWGVSQLRYNYERAYGHGFSDYQVGQTMPFPSTDRPDISVRLDNRATAALYKYTPYVYNGNYNFWRLYDQYFDNPVSPPKELDAYINSQTADPITALKPGETYSAEVKYYNKGTTNWYPDEFHLGTTDPQDRESVFSGGSGWQAPGGNKNRIYMNESHADNGEIATFSFQFKAPEQRTIQTTTYRECFKPVKDSGSPSGWFGDDTKVCFNIPVEGIDATYHYSYINQSPSSPDYVTLLPGRSTTFELKVKNTGESTWSNQTVRLGTDKPRDRTPFYTRGEGWRAASSNRVEMQETSVAPGQEATFRFNIILPENTTGGTYREYFRLVADGITWMEDYGIYWDIKVPSAQERYSYQYFTQNNRDNPGSEAITLYRGDTKELFLYLKNTGLETWTQDTVHLGTSRNYDRTSQFERIGGNWISDNRIKMQETAVAPGDFATFDFQIRVPDNIPEGEYREYFQPVAEHITWMQDYGIYWRIRIP